MTATEILLDISDCLLRRCLCYSSRPFQTQPCFCVDSRFCVWLNAPAAALNERCNYIPPLCLKGCVATFHQLVVADSRCTAAVTQNVISPLNVTIKEQSFLYYDYLINAGFISVKYFHSLKPSLRDITLIKSMGHFCACAVGHTARKRETLSTPSMNYSTTVGV